MLELSEMQDTTDYLFYLHNCDLGLREARVEVVFLLCSIWPPSSRQIEII